MKKRVLGILISIIMATSMMPMFGFAADVEENGEPASGLGTVEQTQPAEAGDAEELTEPEEVVEPTGVD